MEDSIENYSMNVLFDNEALYKVSTANSTGVTEPSFADINRLIAEQASLLTATRRFGGSGCLNFREMASNLVTYPRMNLFSAASARCQTADY